ncbi:MAG: hypothetical protein VB087_03695 [Candidatus Limiplasma sp.]|nr:hypothetical protein [Candidatus Limiplasma sp.]MEA5145025.1 hypothetical protein [Candidatus Limiplasma sp.]
MRNGAKRLLCILALAIFTPFQALAATVSLAGFDGENSNHDWNTNAFFTRMQARTGVTFAFEQYNTYAEWQTAKARMFSGGVLPEVLFKAELTTREQIDYAAQGKLLNLLPLLPDNAPNLWTLLEAHPDWLAAITLPDGKVVALPTLNTQPTQNAMWINTQWLKQLGLPMPTDLPSLSEVLRAFRDGDPNQNGKRDEIPLAYLGPWELKFLAHAVGLVANDYNLYLDGAGMVCFMPQEDAYFSLLTWLTDAYAEGLLDPHGFTTADTLRTVTDDTAPMTYGMFFGPSPMNLLPGKAGAQYSLLPPLAWQGKQVYRDLYGGVTRGTFALTSACLDPAAMLRWVDVLYSEHGAIEAMAGLAGQDHLLSADGSWTYAGDMQTQSNYILYGLSLYDTGNMPWLFPTDFYSRYQNEDIRRWQAEYQSLAAFTVVPFPIVSLTPAQEDAIAPLQAALGRYVDESLARFVLGEWDVRDPAAVAAYRQGLAERGLDAFLAQWQSIADAH